MTGRTPSPSLEITFGRAVKRIRYGDVRIVVRVHGEDDRLAGFDALVSSRRPADFVTNVHEDDPER